MNEYRAVHTENGTIYIQDVVINGVKYHRIEKIVPLDAVIVEDEA